MEVKPRNLIETERKGRSFGITHIAIGLNPVCGVRIKYRRRVQPLTEENLARVDCRRCRGVERAGRGRRP